MSIDNDWNHQHQETLQNIPWFVNGRLSSEEAAAASLHIALCEVCQQELESQRRIRELMQAPDTIEVAPQASFHKLRSRIEEMEREMPSEARVVTASQPAPAAASPGAAFPAGTAAAGAGAPSWLRPLLLGQLAAGVLAASLLLWTVAERWTAPRFQTATSVSPLATQGPALRVVLAPDASVADFGALVRAAGARVVAGPNAQNAWTIELPAATSAAARDALLASWHADARVVLAEPIARTPGP